MGEKIKLNDYTAIQKSTAMLAALGFLINSMTALGANNITQGGTLKPIIDPEQGNVTNIWAGKVNGNNAFSHFEHFELDAGKIANMYFKENVTGAEANRLFNFVDNQIKVDGTVNAIKNNKIGGDLFFLSSSGMVVGNTGVINTGSLYILTPTEGPLGEYTRLLSAAAGETFENEVPNLMTGQIPLNPQGTITVEGQIRATNNIGMYAANINIGAENTLADKIILETGVQFKDLVNIEQTGFVEEAGKLTAVQEGNGDITLVAHADAENTADKIFNKHFGEIVQIDNFVARDIKAEVNINDSIAAAGDLNVKAEAVNGTVKAVDEATGDKLYNSNPLVSTTAKVNINKGKLEGKDVNISAVTENKYFEAAAPGGTGAAGAATGGALAQVGILTNLVKINGSVGALKGDAQVNVAEDAVINAEENLNVTAKNDVSLTLGASTSARKSKWNKIMAVKDEITGGKTDPGVKAKLPAAAAVIGYTEGNAAVNIEGKLTSGKDMNITASSSNDLDLNAIAMVKDESKFVIGLGIAVGNNNSSVNIKDADITAGEDLTVTSEAVNSLISSVGVTAGNKVPAATSLNLVAYDSASNINIENSEIKAENGDITINSANRIVENKIISDNNEGVKKGFLKKLMKEELTAIKDLEQSQVLIDNLKNKLGFGEQAPVGTMQALAEGEGETTTPPAENNPDQAKKDKKKGIGEKISLGSAMAFVGEENSSNINIKGSNITAKNKVNITSTTEVQDTLMSVAGDVYSESKGKFMVGAGVLYGQMGNTSSIVIDGNGENGGNSSTITAENGEIIIKSLTEMKYNRVGRMVQELKDSVANLRDSLIALENYFTQDNINESIAAIKEQLGSLETEIGTFSKNMEGVISENTQGDKNLDSLFSEKGVYQAGNLILKAQGISTQITTLTTAIAELTPAPEFAAALAAVSESIMNAANFANVGNYGNFSVRTTARNEADKAIGIAGSVSITNLQNDSKLVIGKNTKITAKDQVSLNSTNNTEAVNVGGNVGQLVVLKNSNAASSIGGSFIMQDFDVNNVLAVAEGAQIKGSNINIGADTDIFNVVGALSAGKSAGLGINGMVSYSTGSINNLVSIDDEVLLETTGSKEVQEDDKITITAKENTFVTNVAGGANKTEGAGVGIAVAINEFDVNNKIEIKDNDTNKDLADLVQHQHKNKVLEVIKGASIGDLVFTDDTEDKENLNKEINLFTKDGMSVEKENKGITANKIDVSTSTTGMINSVSVAGVVSSKSEGEEEKEGIFDGLKKDFNDKVTGLNNEINNVIGKFNSDGTVNSFMNKGNTTVPPVGETGGAAGTTEGETGTPGGETETTNPTNIVDNSQAETAKPTLNIAAAGSSSVNLIDNVTSAEIDGIEITLKEQDSSINVLAKDESFTGAWSGAAAINWITKKGGKPSEDGVPGADPSTGKSVGVHGAVGINIIDREITAKIKDSTIKNVLIEVNPPVEEEGSTETNPPAELNASQININAVNDSVTVAAGLGLGISKDGGVGNKNYQGGASVSLNNITHNTNALLENSITLSDDRETDINVNALESGIQVTGGLNLNVGESNGAAGAAVTVAKINNTINSGITGGNLQKVGNVNVDGTLDMTQVTASVAFGATTSSEGGSKAFQGAVVYNGTNNTINSYIDGADIDASGDISVKAGDTETDPKNHIYENTFADLGIDTTGKDYYEGTDLKPEGTDESTGKEKVENTKDGSKIITGAMAIVGSDDVAAGAGVIVSDIKNKFTAEIKGTKEDNIKADKIDVSAAADTFIVGAAGGVGIGKDTFGGMGSVSWQELENEVNSKISGVNITAREVNAASENTAFEVNSAGQITYGGKAAAGAVLAYTNIGNKTFAEIDDVIITLEGEEEKNINVSAISDVENYTVGAGVSVSKKAAVAGTVAVAQGGNKTSAAIKDATITNVNNLNTVAEDKNDVYTIVGTATVAKDAAVGGSGVYNELATNQVKAVMENSNIKNSLNSSITVGALDNSRFHTIAAGVAAGGKAAVQGAAAVSTITKDVTASMKNVNINSEAEDKEKENNVNLNIAAQSNSEIVSNATVVAGGGKAGVGAGVAVNQIKQNMNVELNGGTQNVKEALIKGISAADITTIGIGGSAGGNAGIAGSVAVNQITNNNTVSVKDGANLTAKGNVGVIAENDSVISNYAGAVGIGIQGAGIGAAVSINQISGNTKASIEDSIVTAKGETDDTIEVKGTINDILNNLEGKPENKNEGPSLEDVDIDYKLSAEREKSKENKKGVIVDSSTTNTMKSLLASAGIAGQGAGIGGTVNVSEMNGSTTADVLNSVINRGIKTSDVSIHSGDYTRGVGIVGAIGVAGQGAGIGAASDTNILNRTTKTSVTGSSISGKDIKIDADSKQAISSFSAGGAGNGIGAGIAGTVAVSQLKGETVVEISGYKDEETKKTLDGKTIDIDANHSGDVIVGNVSVGIAGVGAGVGASVGVTKDDTTTKISIDNANLTSEKDMNINAANRTRLETLLVASGIGAAGVSGTVSVNNIANKVLTDINNSNLESTDSNITVGSQNNIITELDQIGASAGIGGVAGVVTVNTINSGVNTSVTGGTITADNGKINISSGELRDLEQTVVSAAIGGVAVGANVAVNSIGTAVVDRGDTEVVKTLGEINKEQDNKLAGNSLVGQYIEGKDYSVKADTGAGITSEGIKVKIDSAKLNAKNIDVKAVETDNISVKGGGGTGGAISASASVGITDIKRNIGVVITNDAELKAEEKLLVNTDITGTAKAELYQGSLGAIALGGAYGEIDATGNNLINITDSALSGNEVEILAKDSTKLEGKAQGLSVGVAVAGAIISEVSNSGEVKIQVENSNISGESILDITSEKANIVISNAVGGSTGILSGIGVTSSAKDSGTSQIIVLGSKDQLPSLKGTVINMQALNNMAVSAETGTVSISALAGVGASISEAEISGSAVVSAKDGAEITGDNITIAANIGTVDGKVNTAEAVTDSVGGGGKADIGYNSAKVTNNSSSEVTLQETEFNGKNSSGIKELNVLSTNNTKLKADIDSVSFGGIFAAGANTAEINNTGKSVIELSNNKETKVETLKVEGATISNNTLVSNGNGGGGIAGVGAAIVNNTINTTSKVDFGGNWNVSKLLKTTVLGDSTVTISADSTRGGFVGANGITIKNNITNSEATKVKIQDNTEISGSGEVNVESKNDIDVTIAVSGAAYGGVGFADVVVENKVDKKTDVEIGKVSIETDGKQDYQAFTDADIFIKNQIDAGGLAAVTVGKVVNTLNTSNKVSLADGANLETKKYNQNITFAASDKIKDIAEVIAETSGAGGGSKADVTSNLDRKNRVDINGDILSYNDVNLYAGRDKNGKDSSVNFRALAHAYTKAAIPVADPNLSTNISMGNQVATSRTSDIQSVRHINVEANSGENNIEKAVQKYTWYDQENSSDYVSTENGKTNENINVNDNYADIQGIMKAGIYANQKVVIDGIVDLNMKDGKTEIINKGVTSKPTITYGEGTKINIETGIEDYGNNLIARYNEISNLLKDYSDTKSAAYKGYDEERNRILQTMLSLGLAEQKGKAIVPVGKLDVQYVKISDLVASGGNIVINSSNIKNAAEGVEAGRIQANGNPQVSITNNSNLYLKVGDVRVLEKGGRISFNNETIKDVSSSDNPAINITNNWNSVLNVRDNEGNERDVHVLSTIEVTGNIENLIGDINITNNGGDILMQGEEIDDSTSMAAGGHINLTATGSIAQAYAGGITNIGTAPEKAWQDDMQSTKDEALKDNNLQSEQHGEKYLYHRNEYTESETKSGMAAGGEIYLNGEIININGNIQSGFDKYEVVIKDDTVGYNKETVADLIASYDKQWEKNRPTIGPDNLKDYILTEGEKQYVDGKFYYKPATYYDPSTKQVVVGNINVGGGKVYITGRIISTGNGKITALDGAANINIDNQTNAALKLGSINNKNVEGLVSITDTQRNITVEYRRDKTTVKDVDGNEISIPEYVKNNTYRPDEGQRYNWTEGTETGTSTKYTYSKDFYLWGGIRMSMDEAIEDKVGIPGKTIPLDSQGKPVGNFITQDKNNKNDFSMQFDNKIDLNSTEIVGKREWTDYHDFLHFSGTDYFEWTEKQSTQQTYTGSIKADRDVKIGFIGSNDGNITINSKNNIELSGSIANAREETGTSITNITSKDGNIIRTGGTITADTINLSGKTGIDNINVNGIGDTVNLTAKATEGNVDITAGGNVVVNEILGKNRVELSANGSISQDPKNATGVGVTASRIDLTSKTGGINLVVNSGNDILAAGDTLSASINASADGDISLKETEGNMRIGKIYSSQGNVTLETTGTIIDALPTGDKVENSSVDEMINRWQEAGLIETEEFREKKVQQYNEYKNGVKKEYQEYLSLKAQDEKDSVEVAKFAKLDEKYGSYDSVDKYLENSKEGKDQLALRDSGGKWNKDQLLYAIQDNMINQTTGSTSKEIKDANIKGKEIKITAKGVGVDKGETVIDLNTLEIDDLKKLSSSEVADVTWDKVNNKATIREKNPIGIQMTSSEGKLDITASDNIYLAARVDRENTSSNNPNVIYVNEIATTDGNIRLLGKDGIYNVSQDGTNFTGKDLILEGGAGSLGTLNNPLTMALSGNLTARTDKDIYLNQTGNMNIVAMYAGGKDDSIGTSAGTIVLGATGNIFSVNQEGFGESLDGSGKEDTNLVLGYINAAGDIVLKAEGDIGTSEQGVNILNGVDAKVDAEAKNIYLTGKKEGTLNLGTVIAKESNIGITSESGIEIREELKTNLENGTIDLNAKNNILLGGTVSTNNLNIATIEGAVVENKDTNLTANNIIVNALNGINLQGNNKINSIAITNTTNDIIVNNIGENGLTVSVNEASEGNAGNINITNAKGDIEVTSDVIAKGENFDVTIENTGSIIFAENKNVAADNNVQLTSTKVGNIVVNDINTGNEILVSTNEGSITVNDLTASNITTTINMGSIKGNNFTATNNITTSTNTGNITLANAEAKQGNLSASTVNGNISITTGKALETAEITAETGNIKVNELTGSKISVTTENTAEELRGNIEIGNVTSTKEEILLATNIGNIQVTGKANAKTELSASTKSGAIDINNAVSGTNTNLTTTNGDIIVGTANVKQGNLTAGTSIGDISITIGTINGTTNISTAVDGAIDLGAIDSTGNLTAKTATGAISIDKGTIKGVTDISTAVDGNINLGTINSTDDIIAGTNKGTITANDLTSGNNIIVTTNDGFIKGINFIAANNITTSTNIGDITLDNAEAKQGNLSASTVNGNISIITGTALGTADITTKTGNIDITNLTADKDVTVKTETEGKITSTGKLTSINESLEVYSAKGDINLNEVYAKDQARVYAKDGDIYIKLINGDYVVITMGSKDHKMDVKEQIVGKGSMLSSNDITISDLSQREGYTTPVEVTFNNSEDNTNSPITRAELHAKGLPNGLLITQLWAKDAEISTDGKILQLPKLNITGIGHFANDTTTTTVYGENSGYDNTDISIWNQASLTVPTELQYILLNFTNEPNTIETDGILLKVTDGFKVYAEREAGEEIMLDKLKDFEAEINKSYILNSPFEFVYKPYLNYNLIDNNIENAGIPEIIVTKDKIIISGTKAKEDKEIPIIAVENTEEEEKEKIAQK